MGGPRGYNSLNSVATSAPGFSMIDSFSDFISLHPSDNKDGLWVTSSQNHLYRLRSSKKKKKRISLSPCITTHQKGL